MAPPSSGNVVLGRGKLLFDAFDANGARTGFIHLGNCDQFGLGQEVTKLTMKDSTSPSSAPYAEAVTETVVTVNIHGFEFDPRILALVFMGNRVDLTQTGGSATGETIGAATLAELKGRFFTTAKRSISAVVLKQGATTLVLGTDYEVYDASRGVIRILPTSPTVVTGTALTIDYTYAAITTGAGRSIIRAAMNSSVKGQLVFVSDNAAGPNYDLTAWKINLAPEGETGFISDEWASWNLKGSILSDEAGAYGGSSSSKYYDLVQR